MKIKLFGHEIDVNIDEALERRTGAYGQFSVNTLSMSLDGQVPQSIRLATVIHESVEAINYFHELNLPHNVISSISTGIFELLAENKDVTQAFMNLKRDYAPPPREKIKSIYKEEKPKTLKAEDDFKIDYMPFDNTITAIMEGMDV
jgi:hypothetical protein